MINNKNLCNLIQDTLTNDIQIPFLVKTNKNVWSPLKSYKKLISTISILQGIIPTNLSIHNKNLF